MARLYTEKEIKNLFEKYDKDGSCTIDKEEFIECMQEIFELKRIQAMMKFEEIDQDGNGYIDIEEFTYLIRQIEIVLNPNNVFIQLWEEYDLDHNGVLDFTEFCNIWKEVVPIVTEENLKETWSTRLYKKIQKEEDKEIEVIDFVEYMRIASIVDEQLAIQKE